jgi:hypothetical protein
MKGSVSMKGYLTIVSGIMLILSIGFIVFAPILIPYAVLNLVFMYKKDPPSWIRPTLQYISLALGILAGISAILSVAIRTPDLILIFYSVPLLLVALHGIVEFRYLRGLSSTDSSATDL